MPNRVCGGYQRSSSFKRRNKEVNLLGRNQQTDWWTPGSSGKASRDGGCGYKKEQPRQKGENEGEQQTESERENESRQEEHGRA